MKVFISWSGQLSQKLGEVFKEWLPGVLQSVKPYFTPADIEKGSRWATDIAKELEQAKIGIFIFTRENLDSQWMMFEAGAISKTLDTTKVCPLLFGLDNSDFKGPLTQFQTSQFSKIDVRKLIRTINANLGEQKLEEKVVDDVFEMWWPRLEVKINKILEENKVDNTSVRNDRELLEEMLALIRYTARKASSEKNEKIFHTNYDSEKYEILVNDFVTATVVIFDLDWEHTKTCLQTDNIEGFINKAGNFLEPMVFDESSNWANRVAFLDSFRKLNKFMEVNDLKTYTRVESEEPPF